MRPIKSSKLDRKHPQTSRDAMEDVKNIVGEPNPIRNDIKYVNANRDRALGEADRTGRHYDAEVLPAEDEGIQASKDHEAD